MKMEGWSEAATSHGTPKVARKSTGSRKGPGREPLQTPGGARPCPHLGLRPVFVPLCHSLGAGLFWQPWETDTGSGGGDREAPPGAGLWERRRGRLEDCLGRLARKELGKWDHSLERRAPSSYHVSPQGHRCADLNSSWRAGRGPNITKLRNSVSGEEEAEAGQGAGEETGGEDVSVPREPQGVGTRAFTSAEAWR